MTATCWLRFAVLSKEAVQNGRGQIKVTQILYFNGNDTFIAAVHKTFDSVKPVKGRPIPARFILAIDNLSEEHTQPSKELSYYTKADIAEALRRAEQMGYEPSQEDLEFFKTINELTSEKVLVKITSLY